MFQQTPDGNIKNNSSENVPPSCTSATLKVPSAHEVSAYLSRPCHFQIIPSIVKRKLEMPKDQRVLPPPKISRSKKWQPPPFSKKEAKQSASNGLERAKLATPNTELVCFPIESFKKISEASGILEEYKDQPAPKQNHPPCKLKRTTTCSREPSSPCALQSLGKMAPTFVSDQATKLTSTLHEDTNGGKTQTKASYSSAFLTSDPRVKDCGMLNKKEQNELLQKTKAVKAIMLTMVYRDGTSLLDPEQVSYSRSKLCSHIISFA